MEPRVTRSDLARARGLGSARTGVGQWFMQRATAVALVPLTLWLTAGLIAHAGRGHAAFVAWARTPLAATLLILLLVATFHHAVLGLQVVIEDYLHSPRARIPALIAVRLGGAALLVVGVVSVLRIALGS